jgi:sarcosine oxidase gamma subunit
VVDQSAGLAGLRVRGEGLLRRLTDLDLDELPAVGALAHVQAFVLRDDEETFRLFFPQEYGHYVAEVVVDAAAGLGAA